MFVTLAFQVSSNRTLITRRELPESYVAGNQRPIRRNLLIFRTLYYSKRVEF